MALDAAQAKKRKAVLSTLPPGFRPVSAIARSNNGRLLAVGRGSAIDVFEIPEPVESKNPKPRLVQTLDGHRDVVQALAWSPDGQRLISGGFRRIVIWNPEKIDPVATIEAGLAGRITALEFAGPNHLVAADSLAARPSHLRIISTSNWKIEHLSLIHI